MNNPQNWYAITAKAAADAAEVSIYDSVGGFGVTADQFVRDLKAIDAKTINLRLNTPGGGVFDGTAIYNALRAHPARVVVHIDGLAASIGSVIAMAGDEIRIAKNAYVMIHNPSGGAFGTAEDMRKMADTLDKVGGVIAQTYADRSTKHTKAEFAQMMADTTWFTAKEAKAAGLVDRITEDEAKTVRAALDPTIYNSAPEAVRQLFPPAQPPAQQITDGDAGSSGGESNPTAQHGPEQESEMSQEKTTPPTNAVAEIKPATIAELKAAFPNDPAFALEAAEKALTLVEAKAAYADVLAAKLATTEAALVEAKKQPEQPAAPAPVGNPALGGAGKPEHRDGDADVVYASAKAEFSDAVRKAMKGDPTLNNMTAVRLVAKHQPELYQRMLAEANPAKQK